MQPVGARSSCGRRSRSGSQPADAKPAASPDTRFNASARSGWKPRRDGAAVSAFGDGLLVGIVIGALWVVVVFAIAAVIGRGEGEGERQ